MQLSQSVLYPSNENIIQTINTLFSSQAAIQTSFAGSLARISIPSEAWKSLADWTHSLPTNQTGVWMDALGRDQFFHRWKGHHLFEDGLKVIQNSDHSIVDFGKHWALDLITVQGVPLLPSSVISTISTYTGASIHTLSKWNLCNFIDIAVGTLSMGTAGYDVFLALSGQLPWGFQTAIFTFGVGAAEIALGATSQNPLLVAAGVTEIGAGCISAWDYYSQPFFMGVPVAEILDGVLLGGGVGLTLSTVSMVLDWKKTTASQKAKGLVKNTALAAGLSGLGIISPWLSIPAGLSYAAVNFASTVARRTDDVVDSFNLSSPDSFKHSISRIIETQGLDKAKETLEKLFLTLQMPSNVNDFLEKKISTNNIDIFWDNVNKRLKENELQWKNKN